MLECILDAFCLIWSLKCGCVVVAVYQMLFWLVYLLPVALKAHCYPEPVVTMILCSAPLAGVVGLLGAALLVYGLKRKMPSWSLTWCMYTQNLTILYSLVAGHLIVHSVRFLTAGCPRQYIIAILHLLQLACQYYALMCVNSLFVHLESADTSE